MVHSKHCSTSSDITESLINLEDGDIIGYMNLNPLIIFTANEQFVRSNTHFRCIPLNLFNDDNTADIIRKIEYCVGKRLQEMLEVGHINCPFVQSALQRAKDEHRPFVRTSIDNNNELWLTADSNTIITGVVKKDVIEVKTGYLQLTLTAAHCIISRLYYRPARLKFKVNTINYIPV